MMDIGGQKQIPVMFDFSLESDAQSEISWEIGGFSD